MSDPTFSSSASNIALIYDKTISNVVTKPGSRLSSLMNGTTILDTFFIHTILQSHQLFEVCLKLPHHGEQSERLLEAMEERNRRVAGTGLNHWGHRCNECFKEIRDDVSGNECEI